MLNVFKKKNNKEYKWAFVVDRQGNEYKFRYYKMNRTDISDLDILTNMGTQEKKYIIMTTDSYNFTPENKLKIDGKFYHIESIYYEDSDDENGLFRSNLTRKQYITIKR